MPIHTSAARLAASAATLVALLGLDGCGPGAGSGAADSPDAKVSAGEALGHVHGLGVNPADDTLFAASHFGVFRFGTDGTARRVADRYQDTMGFTVVGPDRFLGSGHPDLSEDLPVNLGLVESHDAARTWKTVSLHGQADFHALDAARSELGQEGHIVGYDAASGRVLASRDGRRWATVAKTPVVDVALDPGDSSRVLVTTGSGHLVAYGLDSGDPARLQAPPLGFVDWPTDELLVGAGLAGRLYLSRDAGSSFDPVPGPSGQVQALDVEPGRWHVATSNGVFRSTDDGRTWESLTR